jgi:hypothetical protein
MQFFAYRRRTTGIFDLMLSEWFSRLGRNESDTTAAKYALIAVLLAMAVYQG